MNPDVSPEIITQSERLVIRRFEVEDYAFLLALLNSEGWLTNIGERHVKTKEQAVQYLRNVLIGGYDDHPFGLWLVALKDCTPVGLSGFLKRPNLHHPDIGAAFLPEHSGKGYATEALKACLEYAESRLGLKQICAIMLPSNKASIRIVDKLGMVYKGEFSLPGSKEILSLYQKGGD